MEQRKWCSVLKTFIEEKYSSKWSVGDQQNKNYQVVWIGKQGTLFLYKTTLYNNTEAEIGEILRIF